MKHTLKQTVVLVLLASLLLQSCYDPIQSAIHDIEQVDYIPGEFKHQEDRESRDQVSLFAPPYCLAVMPKQSIQVYGQEPLQTAPYGKKQQETVPTQENPGKDERVRIGNTTQWPYLFHGQLAISYQSGIYGGSGVLVGPQHILTAAHNVYDHDKKKWAQQVVVRLGLNDNLVPYGEASARRICTFKGWVERKDPSYNMALLVLDKPIGHNTGWCGLLAAQNKDLQAHKVNITGYPGDKGFKHMWTTSHHLKEVHPEELIYEMNTYRYQGDGGIWLNKWGSPYIVGIHSLGGSQVTNTGVRLSYAKAKQVIKWMNETLSFKEHIKELPIHSLSKVTIDALAGLAKTGDANALNKLLEASGMNHAYVQLVLGKIYEEGGNSVTKNPSKTISLYKKAADKVGVMGKLTQQVKHLNEIYSSPTSFYKSVIRRIHKELKDLNENPSDIFYIGLVNNEDIFHWRFAIKGPENSYYSGGIFYLDMRLPTGYPFNPPEICFETKVFHPSVGNGEWNNNLGKVCGCHSNLTKERWSPEVRFSDLARSIRRMLNEPSTNCYPPMFKEAGELLRTDREAFGQKAREWTRMYAQEQGKTSNSND